MDLRAGSEQLVEIQSAANMKASDANMSFVHERKEKEGLRT